MRVLRYNGSPTDPALLPDDTVPVPTPGRGELLDASAMFPADETLRHGLAKAGVANARHHLFFCLGPDCCASAAGEALWEFAKRRIRELDLPVMRTKAGCFRVCAGGPLLLVYPEGIWYAGVTPERLERILCEHLRDGEPVREWIVARQPLTRPEI